VGGGGGGWRRWGREHHVWAGERSVEGFVSGVQTIRLALSLTAGCSRERHGDAGRFTIDCCLLRLVSASSLPPVRRVGGIAGYVSAHSLQSSVPLPV
jgi:hypothetical protein